jgi:hypothetical protein
MITPRKRAERLAMHEQSDVLGQILTRPTRIGEDTRSRVQVASSWSPFQLPPIQCVSRHLAVSGRLLALAEATSSSRRHEMRIVQADKSPTKIARLRTQVERLTRGRTCTVRGNYGLGSDYFT